MSAVVDRLQVVEVKDGLVCGHHHGRQNPGRLLVPRDAEVGQRGGGALYIRWERDEPQWVTIVFAVLGSLGRYWRLRGGGAERTSRPFRFVLTESKKMSGTSS